MDVVRIREENIMVAGIHEQNSTAFFTHVAHPISNSSYEVVLGQGHTLSAKLCICGMIE